MELFPLYANALAIIAIIGGLAIAVWWMMALFGARTREQEDEIPEISLPGHQHEVLAGIPVALWVFYGMIVLALVGYVLLVLYGGATY